MNGNNTFTEEEVEKGIQGRMAQMAIETIEPAFESLVHKQLEVAFRVIDSGEPLDPQVALACIMTLHNQKRVLAKLRDKVKQAEKVSQRLATDRFA